MKRKVNKVLLKRNVLQKYLMEKNLMIVHMYVKQKFINVVISVYNVIDYVT